MGMDLAGLKRKVYAHLVDNHTYISRDYMRYLDRHQAYGNYLGKAKEIARLNWKYRVCRRGMEQKLSDFTMPEGNRTVRPSVNALAAQLMKYDVISFDVFDTLLFRAVERPADVFRLLEAEWEIMGFAKMREEAEQRARKGRIEVTIDEIYQILSQELCLEMGEGEKNAGIEQKIGHPGGKMSGQPGDGGKNAGIERELRMEEKVCYANPYMYAVFQKLKKAGKTIVAVSDMYLPGHSIKRLLESCGYTGFTDIFVSCDYQKTKGSGQLQLAVQEKLGSDYTYVHIGDQQVSDVDASRQIGWDALYYPNITAQGQPYRQGGMDSLASSFYKGLVNARLHSGIKCKNGWYEYGYTYGGILAAGYCQYLEKLVKQEGFDQLLFTARDGYVLHKIYRKWFGAADCGYIPFSRFAAYQLTMERNWKSFMQQAVLPRTKANPPEKIEKVLKICDMQYLDGYLGAYGLRRDMVFGFAQYEIVEKIFRENISQIRKQYREQEEAAEKYFREVIGTHKKICIVDIGWQGTGAVCLKYFLEHKCGMDVQVSGALMGMYGNDSAGICVSTGQLYGYLFSQQKNRDTLWRHAGAYNEIVYRNLLAEILFTEDAPTFLKFRLDKQGKTQLVYGRQEKNAAVIADIQDGICDFAQDFYRYQEIFGSWLYLCGQEAYIPFDAIARDRGYCIRLLGSYEVNESTGIFNKAAVRRFRDIAGDG